MKRIEKQVKSKFEDASLVVDATYKRNLLKQLKGEAMATKKKTNQGLFVLLKSNILTAAIAITVLGLVGGASAVVNGNRERNKQLQQIALPANLDGVLTLDEMRTKAQSSLPSNVTITGVELEQEHGLLQYKVKYSDGSFRLFDAKTGEAAVNATAPAEVSAEVPADFKATIDVQTARTTAQNQKPGGTITSIELEKEEGLVVYSVKFSDGSKVYVDATNGTIIKTTSPVSNKNTDDQDDDHDENDDDDKSTPTPTSSVTPKPTEKAEDSDHEDGSESESHSGSGSSGSGSGSNSGRR